MIKISGGLVVNYNKMLTPGGGGTSFLDEMSKINFDTELQSWSQLPKLENKTKRRGRKRIKKRKTRHKGKRKRTRRRGGRRARRRHTRR